MSCHFCYNAHVWAKEPHNEEDYFFYEGLNPKVLPRVQKKIVYEV